MRSKLLSVQADDDEKEEEEEEGGLEMRSAFVVKRWRQRLFGEVMKVIRHRRTYAFT